MSDRLMIGLQHFGAGDVVNYAGDGVGSNAGTYNVNTNTTVSTGDLAPEIKEFYNKTLLVYAGPNLVHEQFGQKKPVPKGNGRKQSFRKFSKLPKATTPLTEGVTPTGNKMVVTEIEADVDQYGDYIESTDLLNLIAIDNVKNAGAKLLGDQAGETLDTVVRNVLVGGTNVVYAPKVSGGTETEVTRRVDITADCRLRMVDVARVAGLLKGVNAPKIDGSYVAIAHPYVITDIMTEAGAAWLQIHQYKDPDAIYKGEMGSLYGVRFVESTEAKIFAPAEIRDGLRRLTVASNASSSATSVVVNGVLTAASGVSIPCYINGVENTITAITPSTTTTTLTVSALSASVSAGAMVCGKGGGKDGSGVFCTMFLGADAYGVTELSGGGLEYIVNPPGSGEDKLHQRSSQGWKATRGAVRLLEEYMIRVESGSQYSPTAIEN